MSLLLNINEEFIEEKKTCFQATIGEKTSLNQIVCLLMFYFYSSGMYYDEDGDLAEEFYEEVTPAQGTPWMRRITKNLTRQVCSLLFYYLILSLLPLTIFL